MQNWLTGYELQDTVMLFCREEAFFLSSKRKAEFLKAIQSSESHGKCPPVTVLIRDLVRIRILVHYVNCLFLFLFFISSKADKDKNNIKKLVSAAKDSAKVRLFMRISK